MALMKITDIMKAESEEMFSIMASEKITVGVIKKKMQILVVGVLGEYFAVEN